MMLPIFEAALGLFTSNGWIKWVGIGLAVLAIGIYVGWLHLDRANTKVELERTRTELVATRAAEEAAKEVITELEAADAAKQKALEEREQFINEINADREALQRRWQEALRNEPDIRSWADTALPDSVRSLLQ